MQVVGAHIERLLYGRRVVGALIATFLLSRFSLWLLKSWADGGVAKMFTAHAIALMAAALLGGITLTDNGQFAGVAALAMYSVPQAMWLIMTP
jgi:hypothetical protein